MIETLGLVAAILLPLWNIPLIVRIHRRKSSADISLAWALGVEACLLGMLPAGLVSGDPVFRVFAVVNVLFFSAVTIQVVRFSKAIR
jgi:hypothetical protein